MWKEIIKNYLCTPALCLVLACQATTAAAYSQSVENRINYYVSQGMTRSEAINTLKEYALQDYTGWKDYLDRCAVDPRGFMCQPSYVNFAKSYHMPIAITLLQELGIPIPGQQQNIIKGKDLLYGSDKIKSTRDAAPKAAMRATTTPRTTTSGTATTPTTNTLTPTVTNTPAR